MRGEVYNHPLTANLCPIAARFISNIQGFTDGHDTILGSWLDAVIPNHGKWLRCFRLTSAHKGHSFHHYCDGKGPSVVLIRSRQNVFGGFLDRPWGGKCAWPFQMLIVFDSSEEKIPRIKKNNVIFVPLTRSTTFLLQKLWSSRKRNLCKFWDRITVLWVLSF